MRLNTSTPTLPPLFAVASLFCFGSSLPFLSRRAPMLQPLVRGATYSVVPVDGGPAATDEATIVKTIIRTLAPVTIVQTPTNVAVTAVSTNIEGLESQSVLVTTIHTPVAPTATTTAAKYSIINVSSPPTTIVVPPAAASVAPSSTSVSIVASTTSTSTSTSTSVVVASSSSSYGTFSAKPSGTTPTSTSAPIISVSSTSNLLSNSSTTATATSLPSAQPTSIELSTSPASTSTQTYDNGQWHTYYPTWSNVTGTPTGLASVPTLKARLDYAGEEVAKRGIMAALRQIVS